MLGIVHDLNEDVFQVPLNLSEEWEKLELSRSSRFTVPQDDIDALSRFYGSVLNRSPATATLLVQPCLRYTVM